MILLHDRWDGGRRTEDGGHRRPSVSATAEATQTSRLLTEFKGGDGRDRYPQKVFKSYIIQADFGPRRWTDQSGRHGNADQSQLR